MAENITFKLGVETDKRQIDNAAKEAEAEAVKAFSNIKPLKLPVVANTSFKAKNPLDKKEVSKIKELNKALLELLIIITNQLQLGFI